MHLKCIIVTNSLERREKHVRAIVFCVNRDFPLRNDCCFPWQAERQWFQRLPFELWFSFFFFNFLILERVHQHLSSILSGFCPMLWKHHPSESQQGCFRGKMKAALSEARFMQKAASRPPAISPSPLNLRFFKESGALFKCWRKWIHRGRIVTALTGLIRNTLPPPLS